MWNCGLYVGLFVTLDSSTISLRNGVAVTNQSNISEIVKTSDASMPSHHLVGFQRVGDESTGAEVWLTLAKY